MGDVEFFVLFILQNLVQFPENVHVEKTVNEQRTLLVATVDPADAGRVIGRGGITARTIGRLLRDLGVKHDTRYSLRIISNDAKKKVENA